MFKAAFTLMELMVVVVLIGILTALVLPEMRGTYEGALLRSTSRKLVDVFDLANSKAVCLNQLHRVRLDPQTGRYQVEKRLRQRGVESFAPLEDVSGAEGELDKRIVIQIRNPGAEDPSGEGQPLEGQADAISFYPDGTADARELLLKDRSGFRLALRINPITARVHVTSLERE